MVDCQYTMRGLEPLGVRYRQEIYDNHPQQSAGSFVDSQDYSPVSPRVLRSVSGLVRAVSI